jgi:hypothetical protein
VGIDLQRILEGGQGLLEDFRIAAIEIETVERQAEAVLQCRPLARIVFARQDAERRLERLGGFTEQGRVLRVLGRGLQNAAQVFWLIAQSSGDSVSVKPPRAWR